MLHRIDADITVVEVLAEAWSGGIPREEICARVVEAATAGLQA